MFYNLINTNDFARAEEFVYCICHGIQLIFIFIFITHSIAITYHLSPNFHFLCGIRLLYILKDCSRDRKTVSLRLFQLNQTLADKKSVEVLRRRFNDSTFLRCASYLALRVFQCNNRKLEKCSGSEASRSKSFQVCCINQNREDKCSCTLSKFSCAVQCTSI